MTSANQHGPSPDEQKAPARGLSGGACTLVKAHADGNAEAVQTSTPPAFLFRDAIRATGIEPPDEIIADGQIHRFSTNGKHSKNGWYVLHLDGVHAGAFGDWRTGTNETWTAAPAEKLPQTDREAQRKRLEEIKRQRKAEQAQRHAEAKARANAIWSAATPAVGHPYLARKGVHPHGVRVYKDSLIVPVRDIDGEIHSVQFITSDGDKRFLTGGRVAGCMYVIGDLEMAQTIVIGEGFATLASVHQTCGHAVVVGFNAGNLEAVAKAIRARRMDARLIVAADDDYRTEGNPGMTKATAAARAAGALLAIPDFGPDRPDGAKDFNDLALRRPGAVAEGIANAKAPDLGPNTNPPPPKGTKTAPEPLRRPVPDPAPYPMESLGPILADAAIAIRRVIQAPDAICGASVLAAASLASQGLADVHHHGRVYPLSLWMLSIAESGERKTAVDSEAMRAAREFEKELGRVYKDEVEIHRARLAEWEFKQECAKSAAKAAAKKNQGVGLADALLDIGPAPEPPLVAKVTVADFTAEGVAKLLIAGRPTIGAFTDEAALVFGGHGMTKETVARTAGTFCKLWDSGTLDRVRSTEGATKLYGRRMALHLMAQPVIAESALGDALLSGQGFLPRCLLAWPTSTAGSRPYVDESMVDDPALIGLAGRLGELHRLPLPVSPDDDQELAPRALTLTRAAADTWRQLHDAVEKQMAPGARFAACKAWASKTPEQCMRIAGVLTMVESPNATMIEASVIERAAEIALYHLNEAVRLAGTAVLPDEVRNAEALLNWCHETGRTELYSREAQRLGPSRIRDRKTFDLAMKELVEAGWATKIDGGKVLDGAHRLHVWTIKPASEGV